MSELQIIERPAVWRMVSQAIDALNGRATHAEIINYINGKWDDVNVATIRAQITELTVNMPSRIHYPENDKPRLSNSAHDVLFSVGRGQVVKYNSEEHGIWEIYQKELGGLDVRQVTNDDETGEAIESEPDDFIFAVETHLRDFLIKNLYTLKGFKLKMFSDNNGRDGKEYPTGVGKIDILTTDENDDFFVFELKLSRGPDQALGQLLRYMGWVKKNLADKKNVKGIIVANKMDDKIKYAVSMTPDVTLYEYEMNFELSETSLDKI